MSALSLFLPMTPTSPCSPTAEADDFVPSQVSVQLQTRGANSEKTGCLLAWHFLPADRRIRAITHGATGRVSDHADRLVTPGTKLTVPGPPVPAQWGLHAGLRPAEAVFHAPGLILCRVRLSGEIAYDPSGHHVCATEREVLWMADATRTVWSWLVWCARWQFQREMAGVMRLGPNAYDAVKKAIDARALWLRSHGSDTETAAAMQSALGPVRRVYRDACGLDSRGKHSSTKQPARSGVIRAVTAALYLVTTNPTSYRSAASRPPGWYETPVGKAENHKLESCLLQMDEGYWEGVPSK